MAIELSRWSLSGAVVLTFENAATPATEGWEMNDAHYITDIIPIQNSSTVATAVTNGEITLLECTRFERVLTTKISCDPIQQICSFGDLIAFGCMDGSLGFVDIRSGSKEFEFRLPNSVYSISLGYGGSLIAAACETNIVFFDIKKQKIIAQYNDYHSDLVLKVAFSDPFGSILASGGEDGLICTFNTSVNTGEEPLQSILNTECPVRTIGFFGAEKEGLYCMSTTEHLSLWHHQSSQRISNFERIREESRNVTCWTEGVDALVNCSYNPYNDSLHLLTTTFSGLGTLASVTPDSLTPTDILVDGHKALIRCFYALYQEGDETPIIITGGEDARICLWKKENRSDSDIDGSQQKGQNTVVGAQNKSYKPEKRGRIHSTKNRTSMF